ncbi:MAG: methyl-accepting chemotaxis protein [Syntrophomonadaceae bacterium]|nr:methyl-accepting chemotaxis protein [Syntrophomonadaceae bacterium]
MKNFMEVLPVLKYFCTDGICIWLCDTERFIGKVQGKNSPGDAFDVGDLILKGGTARKAIDANTVIYYQLPEEVYGYEANVIAIPLFNPDDQNEVIGVLGLSKSRAIHHKVIHSAQQITEFTEVLAQTSAEVAVGAEEIMLQSRNIIDKTERVENVVQQIQKILKGIKDINAYIKMIALNMMIETARLGEAGRGLDVIAKEFTSLSNKTSDFSSNVDQTLREITLAIGEMTGANQRSMEATERQAAASQELSASVKEVSIISMHLLEVAQGL